VIRGSKDEGNMVIEKQPLVMTIMFGTIIKSLTTAVAAV